MLTHKRIREVLDYYPETGIFRWKIAFNNGVEAGDIAGSIQKNGYRYIGIDGRDYQSSRLAWFYIHGEWPSVEIDHKNRVRCDDKLLNLRLASSSQNKANQGMHSSNTSGHKGVSWRGGIGKWESYIHIDGKKQHLGYFDSAALAAAARQKAATQLHGQFVGEEKWVDWPPAEHME